MRYMVRAAINEWDLLRLYPNHRPQIVGEEYRATYEEHIELEQESKDDPGDDPDSGVAIAHRYTPALRKYRVAHPL